MLQSERIDSLLARELELRRKISAAARFHGAFEGRGRAYRPRPETPAPVALLDTAPIDTLGFAPIAMLPTAPIAMLDVVPVTMPDAASCAGNRSSRANVRRQDRILSICDYETQRRSREILLKGQGFHVESFASSDVLDALFVRGSQIAILCYSVAQARAVRLADTLHRYHPHICVVRLQRMERSTDPCFDQEIDSQAGSDQLVRVIRQVASRLSGANQSPW